MVANLPRGHDPGGLIGSMIGQGFQQGSNLGFGQAFEQAQVQRENSILQQALSQIPANAPIQSKLNSILSLPINNQTKKLLSDSLLHQDKIQSLQNQQQENSRLAKFEDERTRSVIEQNFGKKFADIYMQSPVGGRTELLRHALEAKERGSNLENFLTDNVSEPNVLVQETSPNKVSPTPIKTRDFDKGLTAKERTKRQNERYNKNLPLQQEDEGKFKAFQAEHDAIDSLMELEESDALPQGLGRINVNPRTGDLLIPALASPEAQKYVKLINDFTTRAKDSYGARVTNFDLQQFMRRLPTLANSKDGRKLILDQMKKVNDINLINEGNLRDIIDEHGGIRFIDYDQAQKMAEKRSLPEVSELKREYKKDESELNKLFSQDVSDKKKRVPKGHILVEDPQGNQGYIPQAKLKAALNKGYKKI